LLAQLFGVSRTPPYDWMRQAAAMTDEPPSDADIPELALDEMWPFIQSKKEKAGL
jgi:hypothetical protein